jgi:large subunit ribosomal protein L15
MRLHELSNIPGAVKRRRRVGCGEGGGHGKTCGRGGKGQSARSGSSVRPGFEGGQMPLYRKLPHRGFNNANFRTAYDTVNVGELSRIDESITEVDRDLLIKVGLIRGQARAVKILGGGEITRSLKITAAKFSTSAKEKIEKAGGESVVA